ncbi:MAG: hypothetical protein R6W77_03915 [Trueperaceae bacterium]
MRYLIRIAVLALACCCSVAAQELPAKFVSEDGRLTLFLDELEGLVEVHVMLGYGLIFPLDAQITGDTFTGRLGADFAIEGVLDGHAIHLVLRRGAVEETLSLTRQVASPAWHADSPLLAMLAFVPDTVAARTGGVPGLSFADYGAAFGVNVVTVPSTHQEFAALTDDARASWVAAFQRLQTGPQQLRQYVPLMIESMPELLGIEWFDIERALGYGSPPYLSVVLSADVDAARLGEHLAERDFEEASLEGVTVWHRSEDGQVNMAWREPGDPFVGPVGMAARVTVLPGHLIGNSYWSMTRAAVSTFRRQYPSLADSPDYRTLAEAISQGDGALIQAQFLGPLDVGFVSDDPFGILLEGAAPVTREGPALEPYGLAVLADRQEGADQVAVIAVLYQDVGAAERAAAVLAERLPDFRPDVLESWGARFDPPHVYSGDSGLSAAVVSVRYPLPEVGAPGQPPGGALGLWLRALLMREFGLLRIGP